MKVIVISFFLISAVHQFEKTDPVNGKTPDYSIHLTTMNGNILKGLLLEVKDTSVLIYPGKFKDWKKGTKYKLVEFGFPNIRELALKRKYHSRKKYSINGSRTLFNELKKTTK